MGVIYWQSSQTGLPGNTVTAVIGHLAEYSVLAYLMYRTFMPATDRFQLPLAAIALALTLAYGVSDELHQALVPGRSPDPWDVFTDVIGAAAMLGLVWRRRSLNTGGWGTGNGGP